jgi:hypothetical protein
MSDPKEHAYVQEAKIDWIEVCVDLGRPTQPQHVQRRMPAAWGRPYVRPVADCRSRTSSKFVFRVQNPEGPQAFMRDLQQLAKTGQSRLTEDCVQILGIEIALDTHSPTDNRPETLQPVLEQQIWQQTLLASWPRFSTAGRSPGVVTRTKLQQRLSGPCTINAGGSTSEFRQRWYLKTYDTVGHETYKTLPAEDHRARYEVTLMGKRCPIKSIQDWREFRFETLRTPYFSWRVRVSHPRPLPSWMEDVALTGLIEGSERVRKDRRKTKPGTSPDKVLQARAKNALSKLTRSQRRS